MTIFLVSGLICVSVACKDEQPPTSGILGTGQDAVDNPDGQSADSVSADAIDPADTARDPACENVDEGGACDIPNAAGVCVDGACRFLSCERGYRNCDAQVGNGCEADITLDTRCGACTTTCDDTAFCQPSAFGFVCSTTPVCLSNQIDLDGDVGNGCEYELFERGTTRARPSGLEITAGDYSGGAFFFAAKTSEGPIVGKTGLDAAPSAITSTNLGRAVHAAHRANEKSTFVAWQDAVTRSDEPQSTRDDSVIRPNCVRGNDARTFTGGSLKTAALLSATHGVFELNSDACAGQEACLSPIFDRADYLRSFYPYESTPRPQIAARPDFELSSEAVNGCDTCFLDTASGDWTVDKACLDETVCAIRQSGDPCSDCEPDLGSCPDFSPIAISTSSQSGMIYVVTTTGVVVLQRNNDGLRGVARKEGFAGNVEFVAADFRVEGGAAWIYLLGDDRRLYVMRAQSDPDVEILVERSAVELTSPVDLETANVIAGADSVLMVGSTRGAMMIRTTPLGSTIELVPAPDTAIEDPDLVALAYDAESQTFGLLYNAIGQLTVLEVGPAEEGASRR